MSLRWGGVSSFKLMSITKSSILNNMGVTKVLVVESTLLSCQREVKVFKNMTKRAQITVFSLCNIKIRRGGFELKKSVDHR